MNTRTISGPGVHRKEGFPIWKEKIGLFVCGLLGFAAAHQHNYAHDQQRAEHHVSHDEGVLPPGAHSTICMLGLTPFMALELATV